MDELRAELVRRVQSPDGLLADIVLIEPNGDEYEVQCLLRHDGTTEIGEAGNGESLKYLNENYKKKVWTRCRETALSA